MTNTNWSEKQTAIFDFVEHGTGSAVLIAVAGSGKTTTIVECARRIPATLACAFVAFNKSIAEELKARLPQHVKSQTLNAMGFSAWMFKIGRAKRVQVDANKTRNLMKSVIAQDEADRYGQALPRLVALAKSVGLVPADCGPEFTGLVRDTVAEWQGLIDHYGVPLEDGADEARVIDLARTLLKRSIEIADTCIDFDDQLYMPVITRARFWQNDFLFVDEAQDVNSVQRAMLKRALKPGGRLIAVGDPAQAIYGFRGADTSAIANIKREFAAIELPLTVSYRCPKMIVREAQRFVSHIEAHESAAEGVLRNLDRWDHTTFTADDAILCRNTGPLVETAFRLLRAQVGCRILGREIGQGLIVLIKKMKAQTLETLEERLRNHMERESAKFMARGEENKAEALADRVETIFVFSDNLTENRRTIPALIEQIEALFTDNGKGLLTLCTVHKSKGLEWQRVFIIDRDLMPSKYARQAWQQEQERNIQYVAVTRAKHELCYISSKQYGKQQGKAVA